MSHERVSERDVRRRSDESHVHTRGVPVSITIPRTAVRADPRLRSLSAAPQRPLARLSYLFEQLAVFFSAETDNRRRSRADTKMRCEIPYIARADYTLMPARGANNLFLFSRGS